MTMPQYNPFRRAGDRSSGMNSTASGADTNSGSAAIAPASSAATLGATGIGINPFAGASVGPSVVCSNVPRRPNPFAIITPASATVTGTAPSPTPNPFANTALHAESAHSQQSFSDAGVTDFSVPIVSRIDEALDELLQHGRESVSVSSTTSPFPNARLVPNAAFGANTTAVFQNRGNVAFPEWNTGQKKLVIKQGEVLDKSLPPLDVIAEAEANEKAKQADERERRARERNRRRQGGGQH